jgi:hypothetical protein
VAETELEFFSSRYYEILDALAEWPKMPSPIVLKQLASAGKWATDSPRGKALQAELGLDAIPPVSECELGAGFWDRITNGAWRQSR